MSIADKLAQIAENERRVYETGYERGKVVGGGGEEAYMAGKKYECDKFWDAYQQNGTRTNYANTFYNLGWNDASYNPKYPITASGNAYAAFAYSKFTDTKVDIDISKATGVDALFRSCTLLKTIRNLIASEDTPFANTSFFQCYALEDITVTGTIGQSVWLEGSTLLSKASIKNIIGCLSDTATEKTLTLSEAAVKNAYGMEEINILMPPYNPYLEDGKTYECQNASGNVGRELSFTYHSDGSLTLTKVGDPDPYDNGRFGDWMFPVAKSLPLPKGTYACDGHFFIDLSNGEYIDTYEPFTIEEDGLTADIYFVEVIYISDETLYPNLRIMANEWDALEASKPNWTITLI